MLAALFAAALSYFLTLRLRTYLHAFQQEEYDALRFLQWWAEKGAFDRYFTLGLLIALPFGFLQPQALPLIAALWCLYRIRQEPDPTVTAKKPLVLTPRAQHIWLLAAALTLPPVIALAVAPLSLALPLLIIALAQALPFFLILANPLLSPLQAYQNRRYLNQARTILTRLDPTVIGLTGSFGKTSTKYILNHVLAAKSPVLATPGSVNTPLGIARVVREQLQPQHQYFIAEMGAYGPGSIAGLCRLAPPKIAAITAVGHAHYERFKSLETVATAKFEIADAALANGGLCILHIDAMPDALWQPRVAANPRGYRLVSTRKKLLRDTDYCISAITQSPTGLGLTITHKGKATKVATRLYGAVQAGNIAVAFALAAEVGLPPKTIAAALTTAAPAPHRLNVQHSGTLTTIDDSYNANPAGFATALETLTLIAHAKPSAKRRRILVTPGMVELGTAHDAEHRKLGTLAAKHADIILAINPARIPTFISAIKSAGHETLHLLPTLAAARKWMQLHGQPHDVVLIANDLPDRYESPWNL